MNDLCQKARINIGAQKMDSLATFAQQPDNHSQSKLVLLPGYASGNGNWAARVGISMAMRQLRNEFPTQLRKLLFLSNRQGARPPAGANLIEAGTQNFSKQFGHRYARVVCARNHAGRLGQHLLQRRRKKPIDYDIRGQQRIPAVKPAPDLLERKMLGLLGLGLPDAVKILSMIEPVSATGSDRRNEALSVEEAQAGMRDPGMRLPQFRDGLPNRHEFARSFAAHLSFLCVTGGQPRGEFLNAQTKDQPEVQIIPLSQLEADPASSPSVALARPNSRRI